MARMAEFPDHHTTAVSVKTQETTVDTNLRFDISYIKQRDGILKAAEILFNLLGSISIAVIDANKFSRGSFFTTVAMLGFWITVTLLIFYLFHIPEKFYKIPWCKIELFYCLIIVILYLIAASLIISVGQEGYVVVGVFGYCGMVTYFIDAFFKYGILKSGGLTQGDRTTSRQTTAVRNMN